ncbi:MAG: acyltransferase [Bacteroidaceae bacterium]|nr:acyltransferase [Bacteroidaceae bacterium]
MTALQTIPEQKKRMEWLDAMRGFTMILVVAQHVTSSAFGILMPKDTAIQNLLILFRMPLFFFVSGFLAYSASTEWNAKTLGRLVLKKLRVQLIPTIVFLCAFIAIFHKHFGDALMDFLSRPLKGGYWFTWVLLLMFLLYYPFAYLEAKLKEWTKGRMPAWLPILVLWVIAMMMYETNYMPKYFKYPKSTWSNYLSFSNLTMYFCFFVTGNIFRRYWRQAEKLFDSRWFFFAIVLLAFFSSVEFFRWHFLRRMWAILPRTLAIFSFLLIIAMSFRHYEGVFSKENRIGRMMQLIGTRTLDIYLIHYFFIPHLPWMGVWLKANKPGIVVEMVLIVGIGLAIIAFSLLTSSILRISPIFRKYLFGQKV